MARAFARLLIVAVLVLSASVAVAGSVSLHIGVAPPPPRVEVIGVPPSPSHFWVAGHWRWDGHRHVWVGGRWQAPRSNQVWIRDHWEHRGAEWYFHSGHWVKTGHEPGFVAVVAPAPPAYRVETVPPPPGPDVFWVAGHWRWAGGTHVWVPGMWETRRAQEVWVPAQWVHHGHEWRYIRRALAPRSSPTSARQRGDRSSGGRPDSSRRFAAAATIRFQFSSSSRQAPMRFRPSGGPW